uniref:Coenzyme Q3, methyltransferase n=1 Tax=Chelonoidis abingdonii TaxID=106734 RepID=A0A8C0FZE7_CHEAB
MSGDHQLGSPLSGVKILDVGCGGGLLSETEGSLFITTINKTQLSYILGIVVAERIMGIVPEGTHDWEKFISPEELECLLDSNGFLVKTVNGMSYNPLSGSWSWTESTSINYAVHAMKCRVKEQSSSREPPSETDKEEHPAEATFNKKVKKNTLL